MQINTGIRTVSCAVLSPFRLLTRIPHRSSRHCARSHPQNFPILWAKSKDYELCAGINVKITYTPGLF